MIQLHDGEQGTEEWHNARNGNYTGSNAYKLLEDAQAKRITTGAVSKYATAEASGFGGNFHTKRGHLLEDEAVELYEAIHGVKVLRPSHVTNTNFKGCLYSPDGIDAKTLLEVKCFELKNHMKLISGVIDLKILAQIHYGMTITGRRRARLIAYNPKVDDPKAAYKEISIPFNRDIHNNFKRILTT